VLVDHAIASILMINRVIFSTRRSLLKFVLLALLLSMAAMSVGAPAQARTIKPPTSVTWQPAKLVRGSPVLFQVSAPKAQAITGEWMGHKINFFRYENGTIWYALAGIPVETKAGNYDLSISQTLPRGAVQLSKKVKIGTAKYPRIAAHVAKKFTEPNPEQMKQISADKNVKQAILATESAQKLWSGAFEPPVPSPVSDVFGTERVFNGEVQSRHLGLDFAAPAGTLVHAINSGTVILAQDLYFEGGFIVIDHGQGLLSLYLHLSDFRIKAGDAVAVGEIIATSGSSGRATGPHLHLAARWQGIYVDPAVLLKLNIP
jgi:murein DD-endopeptidase MepM/ murein hydrolase activator NlpD